MALFDYTLEATSGHARAGSFETAHGIVKRRYSCLLEQVQR